MFSVEVRSYPTTSLQREYRMTDNKNQGGQPGRGGSEKMGDEERGQRDEEQHGQRSQSGKQGNQEGENENTERGDENTERGGQRSGQTGGKQAGQGKSGSDR